MTEGQITFRLDSRLKARIQELVAEGQYRNVSDFMVRAILDKFAFDLIPVEGHRVPSATLTDYFSSHTGRRVLFEAVLEGLGQ